MKLPALLSILALLVMASAAHGQNPEINAQFTPSLMQVNSYASSSFDPDRPWSQPMLTTLRVNSSSDRSFRFHLRMELFWSETAGVLADAIFLSANVLPAGGQYPPLSNQDLLSAGIGQALTLVSSTNLTLEDIGSQSPSLRDALRAGFLPDGIYTIRVSVQPQDSGTSSWTGASRAEFSLTVRGVCALQLIQPGAAFGAEPPRCADNPVTFLWNSNSSGFNEYRITIREYPPNLTPTLGNEQNLGRSFFQLSTADGLPSNSLSRFLPFQPDHYYAWRISTRNYTEFHPASSGSSWREDDPGIVHSGWNIFQYQLQIPDQESVNRLLTILQSLQDPEVSKLVDAGFVPLGSVLWEGKSFTGAEAEALLDQLQDKNKYEVRMRHETR